MQNGHCLLIIFICNILLLGSADVFPTVYNRDCPFTKYEVEKYREEYPKSNMDFTSEERILMKGCREVNIDKEIEYFDQCLKTLNKDFEVLKDGEKIKCKNDILYNQPEECKNRLLDCKINLPYYNATPCIGDIGFEREKLVSEREIGNFGGVICVGAVEIKIHPSSEFKNPIKVTLKRYPYYSESILSIKDKYVIEPVGLRLEENFTITYFIGLTEEYKGTNLSPYFQEMVESDIEKSELYENYKKDPSNIPLRTLLIPNIINKVDSNELSVKSKKGCGIFINNLLICCTDEKGDDYLIGCDYREIRGYLKSEPIMPFMFTDELVNISCEMFGEITLFPEFLLERKMRFKECFYCGEKP